MSTLLSKSTFIRSLQCQKSLFLYKNYYHLRDEISLERQRIFERGHEVGKLAQQLFPGGIDVGWESPKEYKKSVQLTQERILKGDKIIYEAAFLWNEVLVAADIIVKEGDTWHIYEVKSSLSISETYYRDAALQLYMISKSGLKISGISMIHLNKNYIREQHIDLHKLFKIEDVTQEAELRIGGVIMGLIEARNTLNQNTIPDIRIGPQCDNPYTCDFKGYCGWNKIPKNSVFELEEIEEEQVWTFYNQNIVRIEDIPADYPFTITQKITWQSRLTNEVFINQDEISSALDQVILPAAFLDIQVFRPAVPLTSGAHPYKQIPFGFGMKNLTLDSDNQKIEIILAEPVFDFEESFLKRFISETAHLKSLIVFDKKRELRALVQMTERFPQYTAEIEKTINATVDLADIFNRRHFYHPKMNLNLRDMPAIFGYENVSNENQFGSDSLAGTAFEYLYRDGDLLQAIEIKALLKNYLKQDIEALELIYRGLTDTIDH